MNSEDYDFSDAIKDVIVEREKTKYKVSEIKLNHFYFKSDDKNIGDNISISIELKSKYNYELEKLEWTKVVSHTYYYFDEDKDTTTDEYSKNIDNSDDLISQLEEIDLRDLKNNYFTEKAPENLSHWELTYNNFFKIVGTYDQMIPEVEKISELLDFDNIKNEEENKVKNKLGKQEEE